LLKVKTVGQGIGPGAELSPDEICTPDLIAAYNSHLEIKAGRVVSLIP
jgi:hypothetical protein